MADENNGQIKLRLYTLIFLLVLVGSTVWGLSTYLSSTQSESQACIAEVERGVTSNTRRIEALERQAEAMEGIPAQISGMSTDLRYLRRLVETLAADWRNDRQQME